MRLLALTVGGPEAPSTNFRILQFRDLLEKSGVIIDVVPAKQFRDMQMVADYDAVILQKVLLPVPRVRNIRRQAKFLVYDVDDLVWLSPGKKNSWLTRMRLGARIRNIARNADVCVAANGVISAELERFGGTTRVVPMALDGQVWHGSDRLAGEKLTIGWSGAPHNIPFLRQILPELQEVQRRFPDVRWVVHSGADPHFEGFRYEHVPFQAGQEPLVVRQFHIGLLPLPDDPFVRGKSPIKALQYFASGVAIAGSPVGATCDMMADGINSVLVREGDWVSVLSSLITDHDKRLRIAAAGRDYFVSHHEKTAVFHQLMDCFTTFSPNQKVTV